jgi:hypothetical protein
LFKKSTFLSTFISIFIKKRTHKRKPETFTVIAKVGTDYKKYEVHNSFYLRTNGLTGGESYLLHACSKTLT